MKKPPAYIAKHIRTVLKNGGSAPHTMEVQRFFKHEVKSRGWYTGELRKVAVRFRRTILAEHGLPYLAASGRSALSRRGAGREELSR